MLRFMRNLKSVVAALLVTSVVVSGASGLLGAAADCSRVTPHWTFSPSPVAGRTCCCASSDRSQDCRCRQRQEPTDSPQPGLPKNGGLGLKWALSSHAASMPSFIGLPAQVGSILHWDVPSLIQRSIQSRFCIWRS
jgi:hypothetical protein